MALVNFTNLDFDQIKSTIREYLRANSNFTDYDFEGSNLSTLIDVLAYNTYITSYNANMISNEVFIDSATLRENVVSLARNIGYTPKSRTSSRARISFFIDTSSFSTNPISITLKKGLVCTSNAFGNQSYTFSILEDITVPVVNDIALFENVEIIEGTYITQSFTVDSNNPNQRYILSNANIDTNTITVSVRDTETCTVTRKFILSNNLFDVTPRSKVFFIQEIEDQRYELIFGDDIFGKKLDNLNVINTSYVISNGESGNGISAFNFVGSLSDNNGRIVTNGVSLITTVSPSQSGSEIESVNSIRNYAPRIYSSQNRAVTANDYEALIPRIYPETESVSAFGGEELTPPSYGKVFISIKPKFGPFIPNLVKDNLKRNLRKYSVAGIVPEILDLKYLYIEVDSSVYYNQNLFSEPSQLKTIITDNIIKYSEENLNSYSSRFKYSKFLKVIDDSNQAITSNITKIKMRRDLKVELNKFSSYLICYGNPIYPNKKGFNIKSSGFTIAGNSNTLYLVDIPNCCDGKTGTISFFKLISDDEYEIVRKNAGTIDYEKGEINLYPVNISGTSKVSGEDSIIQISALPQSNDIIGKQELYIEIDINNSSINMLSDNISSGSDISGSDYIITSSYSNGNLVRT
jgi:hypothetical protein